MLQSGLKEGWHLKTFLTLDVGTTAVKAALFDEKLKRLGLVIREYTLLTPGPDQVELPAAVYWENVVAGIKALLAQTGVSPAGVCSITCTTQGETLIPVGRDGEPLYNAIVWLDARPKAEAALLEGQYTKAEFYGITGIPEISPYCPVAKLLWFLRKKPDIYGRAHKFLLLEDYLIYRLTGRFVTNPALLCTTGYFDIRKDRFWLDILQNNGLDAAKLPDILPCGTIVGPLGAGAAAELGLTQATQVTTGAMDQVAAAIGTGNIREDVLSETTGTCLAVGAATREPNLERWTPVPVYSHALPGLYLKIVIMQTAGMALKWFRNEFCPDLMGRPDSYGQMTELARQAPPLSRGLILFPHFTGMYADPNARGVFFGVGLDTGRDCFIRAIMEAIGYMVQESIELLEACCTGLRSMGGGSKSHVWNQIKADVCNVPVHVMGEEEAASLGAALLGGLAVGAFSSLEEGCGYLSIGRTFTPGPAVEDYRKGYAKYKKLYERFAPLFQEE